MTVNSLCYSTLLLCRETFMACWYTLPLDIHYAHYINMIVLLIVYYGHYFHRVLRWFGPPATFLVTMWFIADWRYVMRISAGRTSSGAHNIASCRRCVVWQDAGKSTVQPLKTTAIFVELKLSSRCSPVLNIIDIWQFDFTASEQRQWLSVVRFASGDLRAR